MPTTIPQLRTFKRATDVLRAAIVAANPATSEVRFENLKATVDVANKKITLSLVDSPVDKYLLTTVPAFTYTTDTLADFAKNHLGLAKTYAVEQVDAVIAAIPEGLELLVTEPDSDGNITGTLRVVTTPRVLQFGASTTLATLFLPQNETVSIKFLKDVSTAPTEPSQPGTEQPQQPPQPQPPGGTPTPTPGQPGQEQPQPPSTEEVGGKLGGATPVTFNLADLIED